jgi:hypothetical protein
MPMATKQASGGAGAGEPSATNALVCAGQR